MIIPLKDVTSSQIAQIGHDPETQTLAILLRSGGLYYYDNFTAADFIEFASSPSLGSHFYRHIKHNKAKYPYRKVI